MKFIINNNTITQFIYGDNHSINDTTLIIPEGIERITQGADDELVLRQYKVLILPSSLKKIDEKAMIQLRRLEKVILQEGSPLHFINGCLYSSDKKELIISTNGNEHINIIDGCERLYEGAFMFRDMQTLSMPNSVTYIGKRCFLSCYTLKNIDLSNNLNTLNESTFTNCDSLNKLYIPKSINEIKRDAIPSTAELIFHAGSIAKKYAIENNAAFTELLY